MAQVQFADLTSGYERFDALRKNLEGIFAKIYQMREFKLDISYYEEKFESFKQEFSLADDFLKSSKMPFEGMQKDYEAFTLGECNKKLEALTDEFEENVTPIYNIYCYFNAIEEKINNRRDDDIDDVVTQTILLIDQINAINTHNKIEVTRLLDKAYEVIFNALLYEKVYDRHDILDFLRRKNLSTNRENLGKVVRESVNKLLKNGKLSNTEVDEEFLAHIDEGLGYDYLSDEFLGSLSKKILVEKYDNIESTRLQANADIIGIIDEHNREYMSIASKLSSAQNEVKNNRSTRAVIAAKAAAIFLIPMISLGIGAFAGRLASNQVDMYATVTRSINIDTGEIVNGPEKIYDERSTTYVASITIYEPWRKNPTSVGYIRTAVNYEYFVPENVGDDFHITKKDIEGHLKEKYRFNQVKDKLDENDSMTDAEIIVTETYQDKNDVQKSTKYIVPFALIGLFLSSILEGLVLYKNDFTFSEFHNERYYAYKDLKNSKKSRDEIKKELNRLKERAKKLKAEKAAVEREYGIQVDASILPEEEIKGKRH